MIFYLIIAASSALLLCAAPALVRSPSFHDLDESAWGSLPLLPPYAVINDSISSLGGPYTGATLVERKGSIPKHIWITVRTKDNFTRKRLEELNPSWTLRVVDDNDMEIFMKTAFNGSAALLMYELVNKKLGAMRADIWRYAVLYAFGGVYIDYDSGFSKSLNDYILPNDSFIFASEPNEIRVCFDADHKLRKTNPQLFGNKMLINWLLISKPGNPVLADVLKNIIDLVKREFYHKSALDQLINSNKIDRKWRVICLTGPGVFTSTIHLALTANASAFPYRYDGYDFQGLGAMWQWTGHKDRGQHTSGSYGDKIAHGEKLLSAYNHKA